MRTMNDPVRISAIREALDLGFKVDNDANASHYFNEAHRLTDPQCEDFRVRTPYDAAIEREHDR